MRIIKVDAINSTNNFARDFYKGNTRFEPVCIVTRDQTNGRGQRGAGWSSKPGENLTFSILYPKIHVEVNHQFLLSSCVSLAILQVLERYNIPRLKVKWPNDIMAGNYKIAGILIENIIKNDKISASIIGIGLNVNQTEFENLPKASSLKKISGRSFFLEDLLETLLEAIQQKFKSISKNTENALLDDYEKQMFRRNKVSTFQLLNGTHLTGIIRGITTGGLLRVEIEEDVFKTFDLKELKLLF